MKSIYRGYFDQLKALVDTMSIDLNIKTIHFGGLERFPKNQILWNELLNLVCIRPLTIDEDFYTAQRQTKQNSTLWKIYFITKWDGSVDNFNDLMFAGEKIMHKLNENMLTTFTAESDSLKYNIRPRSQIVQRIIPNNDAEIFFVTGGIKDESGTDLSGIVLELKIDSLINKINT